MSNYYISKCCGEQVGIKTKTKDDYMLPAEYVCLACKQPCDVTAMIDKPGGVPDACIGVVDLGSQPVGYSQWITHGKKYGYHDYWKEMIRLEIEKENSTYVGGVGEHQEGCTHEIVEKGSCAVCGEIISDNKKKMEPNDEPIVETAEECGTCGKRRASVSCRPNGYANDVGNDPDAMHTVCDYCDYQNRMDI